MSQTVVGPKGGLQMTTMVAGAAIAKGMQVKRGADLNTAIPNAAATTASLGVAMDDQDTAGRTFPIANGAGEFVLVRSGAAFALDARLTSDGSGRAITAASTNQSILIAREAATAADQLVTAEMLAQGSVAP